MSRIAKAPVDLPQGVTATIAAEPVTIKGAKGSLSCRSSAGVSVDAGRQAARRSSTPIRARRALQAGATRAHLANMVLGVTKGYERSSSWSASASAPRCRARALNLTLGFSHPVNFPIPEGITIETPTQTEIIIKGIDRQKVGQVAAEIRDIRPPEPYKGKGVSYAGEKITLKEGKKK